MIKVPFTVIMTSNIPDAGVGVFSTKDIKKGTNLDYLDYNDGEFVSDEEISNVDEELAFWIERYAFKVEGGWECPKDINRMHVSWYMNDSDIPTVGYNTEDTPDTAWALCDIIAYETELTISYKLLEPGRSHVFVSPQDLLIYLGGA